MSTRAVIQDWSFTTDVPSKLSAQTLLKRSTAQYASPGANAISVVTECGGARHGHVDNGNDYSLHMNRCDASTTLANNPRTGVSADNRTNRSAAPTVLSNTTGIGGGSGANTSTLPLDETKLMASVFHRGGGANTYATSTTTPLSIVNDNSSSAMLNSAACSSSSSSTASNSMSNGGSRIAHARVNLSYLAPTLNQSTCAAVEEVAYEYAIHFPIKDWK